MEHSQDLDPPLGDCVGFLEDFRVVVPDAVPGPMEPMCFMGGPGGDFCLFAADEAADDSVYGGGGSDTFEIDPGDTQFSVEIAADCLS